MECLPSFVRFGDSTEVLIIRVFKKTSFMATLTGLTVILNGKKTMLWRALFNIGEDIFGLAMRTFAPTSVCRPIRGKSKTTMLTFSRMFAIFCFCELTTPRAYKNVFWVSCVGSKKITGKKVNTFPATVAYSSFYPHEILHVCVFVSTDGALRPI